MNIYVGNLSYEVTDDDLRQAFEAYGAVSSATVVKDKFSGASRGFGFVEMSDKGEGEKAIAALNGKNLKGRSLNVNEARPREERSGGGVGGGGGGGRGGGGGGGRDRRGGSGGGGGGGGRRW
jgi:RNA recognition motif-containing protein